MFGIHKNKWFADKIKEDIDKKKKVIEEVLNNLREKRYDKVIGILNKKENDFILEELLKENESLTEKLLNKNLNEKEFEKIFIIIYDKIYKRLIDIKELQEMIEKLLSEEELKKIYDIFSLLPYFKSLISHMLAYIVVKKEKNYEELLRFLEEKKEYFNFSSFAFSYLKKTINSNKDLLSFLFFLSKIYKYKDVVINSSKFRSPLKNVFEFGMKKDPFRIIFHIHKNQIIIDAVFSVKDHSNYEKYLNNLKKAA